jgi:hypothetical protein
LCEQRIPEEPETTSSSAVVSNQSLNASQVVTNEQTQDTFPDVIVYLKVHLYSTAEVKQTTTIQASSGLLISDVFDIICKKRKFDHKDYVLKMADVKTDVDMNVKLGTLNATEFCVLKRVKGGGGAGDVFLRQHETTDSEGLFNSRRFTVANLAHTRYKQYNVHMKHFLGRQSRELTIDGQFIHILALDEGGLLDMVSKSKVFH